MKAKDKSSSGKQSASVASKQSSSAGSKQSGNQGSRSGGSAGTQGGTHEQHVEAGRQSHKNDSKRSSRSR